MTGLLLYLNLFYCCVGKLSRFSWSWDTFIAGVALVVAFIAILITVRYQILSFVEAQLIEIAKTCNSYLQDDYQVHKDGIIERGAASSIVTALEDAEKIINHYYKKRWLIFKYDVGDFKGTFYNHLHSSIKVVLKNVLMEQGPGFVYKGKDLYDPIRKDQLDKVCEFLVNEIKETWKFEKDREKRLGIS